MFFCLSIIPVTFSFPPLISVYSDISPFLICPVTWDCLHSLVTRKMIDQNYSLGRELCFVMTTVITAEGKWKYNIQGRSFRQRGGGGG